MRIFIYSLLLLIAFPNDSFAQKKKEKKDYKWETGLFLQMQTASNFYDVDGTSNDRDYENRTGDTISYFIYDHKATFAGIYTNYIVSPQLKLGAALPFAMYSQQPVHFREYRVAYNDPDPFAPDSIERIDRVEFEEINNNRLLYISLKGQYLLLNPLENKVIPFVATDIRVPFGFESGTQNSGMEYWDDYFFEIITSAGSYFKFEKSSIAVKASYDYRAEDMSDMIILDLKAGLSTVEDTELYFNGIYAKSLDEASTRFNYLRRPYAETYMNVGFGFTLVYDPIFFDINYNIPVLGENTWKTSVLNTQLGYRF